MFIGTPCRSNWDRKSKVAGIRTELLNPLCLGTKINFVYFRNGGLEGGILGNGGRREDDSDWRTGLQKPPPGPRKPALKGETNFISGETNFL